MAGVIFDGKLVAPAIVVEKEPSTLDPLWPDIEKLLIENWPSQIPKETGNGCAVLLYGFIDTANVLVNSVQSAPNLVIMSDGTVYDSNALQGAVHTWDKSKDIYGSDGLPVRYILLYKSAASDFGLSFCDSGWFNDPVIRIYFKGEFQYDGSHAFSDHTLLRDIKIDGKFVCTSSSNLLSGAFFLKKVPDNLYTTGTYTSQGVPFSGTQITEIPLDRIAPPTKDMSIGSLVDLPAATIMPEFIIKLKVVSLSYFAYGGLFQSLVKIPDGWDLSRCTDFSRAGHDAQNLRYAGTVDMSSNTTSFTSARSAFNCSNLIDIKCTLPSNTNVWFNSSTKINIESFRFMADHAPDVTATPRTLTIGSTNISRINAADPTIITDLNAKGWNVA